VILSVCRDWDETRFVLWEVDGMVVSFVSGEGAAPPPRCAACELLATDDSDFCPFHDELDGAIPPRGMLDNRRRSHRLGFISSLACSAGWAFIDPPKVAETYRRRRDRVLAKLRADRDADREAYNAYMREHRARNRDKVNAQQRQRYAKRAR
jgi:hypothetical protein